MAKMFSVEEQLSVLSPEQLEALKQELIRQYEEESARETQSGGESTRAILGKGLLRGISAFSEGTMLGAQGRPISEHSIFRAQPQDKYEELMRMEKLKNVIDPSRIKAQEDIEDARIKRQVRERKFREQQGMDTIDIRAEEPQTIKQISRLDTTENIDEEEPPRKIKIGEDEYGINIYGDNPAHKEWEERQKENRQLQTKIAEEDRANLTKIAQEERSVDLIARKAAEKDRQLNIGKVSRLTNLVDLIETEYTKTKTPTGLSGILRRPLETFTRGIQITENQRQDKAYGEFIKGMRVQLARALAEVGALSEPEQKAALDLVPDLLTDPRTAAIKFKQLRDLVITVQGRLEESQMPENINNQNIQSSNLSDDPLGLR